MASASFRGGEADISIMEMNDLGVVQLTGDLADDDWPAWQAWLACAWLWVCLL